MLSSGRYSSSYDESDSSETDTDTDYESYSGDQIGLKSKLLNRGRWTKEEDDKLRQVVETYGSDDWKQIAAYFPDRSEMQCYHRWQKVLNPDLVKGPWTKEEDDRVIELVKEFGPKRWSLISKYLIGRTGKQCRERWHNHLNPDIKKSAWTQEEDRIIYHAHKRLGNRWAEIAKLLPGRTDNAIKNHWNSTMKRKVENCNPYTPNKQSLLAGFRTQDLTPQPVSLMYAADMTPSDFNAGSSSIHAALKSRGPNQGVVRTLYQSQASCSNQGYQPSRVQAQAYTPHWSQGKAKDSPMKWTVRDCDGILSPIRDFPDFGDDQFLESDITSAELSTFDFLLGGEAEPTVTPIKFSKLYKGGSRGYRFDSHAISDLSRSAAGNLIPITSPQTSKFSTPPTILRKSRYKRKRTSRSSHDSSTLSNCSYLSSMSDTIIVEEPTTHTTPNGTPIKSLPFSPSQFLNMGTPVMKASMGHHLTSTPIGGNINSTPTTLPSQLLFTTKENTDVGLNYRTPRIRRSLIDSTPRTPTPLKDALAELEKKSGPLKHMLRQTSPDEYVICRVPCRWRQPRTPGQLQDISEIIEREEKDKRRAAGKGSTPKRKYVSLMDSPTKRVRKSLNQHLLKDEPLDINIDPETSAILPDASSLLMSPLAGSSSFNHAFIAPASPVGMTGIKSKLDHKDKQRANETPSTKPLFFQQLDKKYETIACGKTDDQRFMSEQARRFLRAVKPRSLIL